MTSDKEPETRADDFLQRLTQFTRSVEDGLLLIMLSTMIMVAGIQILMRNVWDSGIAWGDPLLRMMVLWVGLLGAMVATRENNHISIDILSRILPPRLNTLSRLVTDLFTSLVCALLCFHAARFVLQDHAAQVLAFAGLPAWLFELIIPLGFGVISLRYCARVISGMRRVTRWS